MRACLTAALLLSAATTARADDWPQWLGPQRDGVWRETGLLDTFPPGGPKARWRVPVGGGYAGPAVAAGKVYVADRVLDEGEKDPDDPFARTNSLGKERVHCIDAASGKVLWTHAYPVRYTISYPCGPRTTPLISGGKVYVLGAMGNLVCLDAAAGKVVWEKDLVKDFQAKVPGWGFAASPLLDGDKLICLGGGKDGVVMAFHKDTGKELWRSLSIASPAADFGYSPPMIYRVGATNQLIVWHPESVNGLDPATGKPLWSVPFKLKANLAVPTPVLAGDKLLVSSFYNGSMLLELAQDGSGAKVVWKGQGRGEGPGQTDTLHSIMPTPYVRDGHIYGVCSYGELRCLRLADGKRVWEDLTATSKGQKPKDQERWANAFLTPQGDRWFLFNEKGDLIIAKLSPDGYKEVSRAHLLEPTSRLKDRSVVWSHPAYAERCIFVRNDKEVVCVPLAADKP